MQRWADGDATDGARSIAEVVKAARAMTGKPARASDEEPVSSQALQLYCGWLRNPNHQLIDGLSRYL